MCKGRYFFLFLFKLSKTLKFQKRTKNNVCLIRFWDFFFSGSSTCKYLSDFQTCWGCVGSLFSSHVQNHHSIFWCKVEIFEVQHSPILRIRSNTLWVHLKFYFIETSKYLEFVSLLELKLDNQVKIFVNFETHLQNLHTVIQIRIFHNCWIVHLLPFDCDGQIFFSSKNNW